MQEKILNLSVAGLARMLNCVMVRNRGIFKTGMVAGPGFMPFDALL